MKTDPGADVSAVLRSLRRRVRVRESLDTLAIAALAVSGVFLAEGLWARFGDNRAPISRDEAVLAACLILGLGVVRLLQHRRLRDVARIVDHLGGTKDRLTTALALSRTPESAGGLSALARAECAAFLAITDLRPLIPLHPPRTGVWLVVPLIALGFLQLDFDAKRAAKTAAAEQAQESVADTASKLEELARQAQKASEQTKDDELKKLAEQLQRSADQLRRETRPEEAPKAALREISSLEQMMRDLQRQPSMEKEIEELAKALAALPKMQDVLKALNEKNLAEAQKALERARGAQKEGKGDQASQEQVEKALREAVQNLADRRKLSDALQRLADRMKDGGGQSLTQEAMQQLQEMMQQAQTNRKSDGKDSAGGREMTVKEMLSALENMKFGEGQDEQDGPGGGKPGDGQRVTIQSFNPGNAPGAPQSGEAQMPTGKPGSERDFGTTKTPFGGQNPAQDKGGELALKGQLGKGETLSMMLPAAADQSRAARRYKDLYEAAAASAQDAVQQENIPLGSRFLIRRYFESIRPQE